jgi:probable F420-dependent oxidoreductase
MRTYLDELDAHATPVPPGRRMIGALGPRMLELATARTRGSVPYLVSPGHTAFAREALGETPLLAPEVGVVLDDDLDRGRATAREALAMYLGMPNYTNNFARFGFGPEHLEGGGSDELVDAVFAVGDVARIRERLDAHVAAGADHVALQVVTRDGVTSPDVFAALAPRRA